MKNLLEVYDTISLLHEKADRASVLLEEVNTRFLQPLDSKTNTPKSVDVAIMIAADTHSAAIKSEVVEDMLDELVKGLADLANTLKANGADDEADEEPAPCGDKLRQEGGTDRSAHNRPQR